MFLHAPAAIAATTVIALRLTAGGFMATDITVKKTVDVTWLAAQTKGSATIEI